MDNQEVSKADKCSDCGKSFLTGAKLLSHKQVVHANGSFVCEVCSKEFKNKDYLRNHVRLIHQNGEETMQICDQCSKLCKNKGALHNHKKAVHDTKVHTCDKCDAIFKSGRTLKKHIVKCKKETNEILKTVFHVIQDHALLKQDILAPHIKKESVDLESEPNQIKSSENEYIEPNEVSNKESINGEKDTNSSEPCDISNQEYISGENKTNSSELREVSNTSNKESASCEKKTNSIEPHEISSNENLTEHNERSSNRGCENGADYIETSSNVENEMDYDGELYDFIDLDFSNMKENTQKPFNYIEIAKKVNFEETCNVKSVINLTDELTEDFDLQDNMQKTIKQEIKKLENYAMNDIDETVDDRELLRVDDTEIKIEEFMGEKKETSPNENSDSDTVLCEICSKQYSLKKLKEHMKHVHGTNGGNCPTCGKYFASQKYLRYHMTQTHLKKDVEEENIICHICSKELPSSRIKAHARNYHSDENLSCKHCGKLFLSLSVFRSHVRNVHSSNPSKPKKAEKTEICEICSRMFSKYKLKEHLKDVHGTDGGDCPTCGKFFRTSKYLRTHISQRHMIKEIDESVSLCEFCPKEMVASKIKAHVRNYHSSKNLNCDLCGKTYNNLKYFRAHLKMVHSGTMELCQICSKIFSNGHYLRQHIRLVHESTENSVQCQLCQKSFGNNSRLNHHTRAVHSQQDSPCHVCGKIYKNAYLLRKHVKKYHTEAD